SGRKVAICEQLEDVRPGKLVKREVTQILSPGTHFDERLLSAERNNFLAAVNPIGRAFGVALVDLTTGQFLATELENEAALLAEMERVRPAEIIFPAEKTAVKDALGAAFKTVAGHDGWTFAPETAVFTVQEHFQVASLDGFGLRERKAAIGAAGGILHYLTQHLRRDVRHLTRLSYYQRGDFLVLDSTALRNLEILEPLRADSPRNASLYGAMNRTVTPMGARLLRQWLSQPLATTGAIGERQEAVRTFIANPGNLENFRAQLPAVRDLERTLGRLGSGSGNARDLAALRTALEQAPALKDILSNLTAPPPAMSLIREETAGGAVTGPFLIERLNAQVSGCPALVELVSRAIEDDPPPAVKEGGMIRDGFDAALDELRHATRGGKEWIAKLQADEIARTGISSLKVRFNSVFGYYIEVTKANLGKAPAHYIRKQTTANGERFITPELKEMEGKILGAQERCVKLEYDIFQRVRETALESLKVLQQSAGALAQLDVLACFAET
ncbi:MAG: DNA mismatch repair protein MutS, partial [Verrucomicrobia bacterium]|nr:DNA mismatch repair protein MutS [Verrucomicrobiota bacterium]